MKCMDGETKKYKAPWEKQDTCTFTMQSQLSKYPTFDSKQATVGMENSILRISCAIFPFPGLVTE